MATVHIHSGNSAGLSTDFEDPTIFVGRGPDNDIQINENSVSRRHLKISNRSNGIFIEDLKSQNGTFINNQPLRPGSEFSLAENTRLMIGDVQISITGKDTDNSLPAEYWVDLPSTGNGSPEVPIFKDRRLTDRDQLELIHEVSTMLMQSLDINEICGKIMDSLFLCLERIDNCMILLADSRTGKLKEVISKDRDMDRKTETGYSRTIVDRVMREGKAVVMKNTSLEDRDDLSESIELMKIKSLMCVPLICKSRVLGVIYAHSVKATSGFRKEDLFLFSALSSPAALAIENALLYERSSNAEQTLKTTQAELEDRVKERTAELSEANKNLGLAYSQMREYKDRLSILLQGEERGFLLSEEGRILGATEKATESTGMTRTEIIGNNIFELINNGSEKQLKTDLNNALRGVFIQTSIQIKGKLTEPSHYFAKLMHLNTETGKNIIMLIRKSLPGERTFKKELVEGGA